MLTNQEIYDRVCVHLFEQGKRCVDPVTLNCLYRGPEDTKCAVGVLINDEEYNEDLEFKSVGELFNIKSFTNFNRSQGDLLSYLQQTHDTTRSWSSELALRSALIKVGIEFELDCTKVSGLRFDTSK